VNRFEYLNYLIVVSAIAFLPFTAQAQTATASVGFRASVSETVALSLSPSLPPEGVELNSVRNGGSLMLTLSGFGPDVATVRVPILVRSNIAYEVSALVQSETTVLTEFAVLKVRATGKLVAAEATTEFGLAQYLDRRSLSAGLPVPSLPVNGSSFLNGPRVSLGGTLNSADNALEITLLITVKPNVAVRKWLLQLTLTGAPKDSL
jgi:hypothetical protein